MSRQPSARDEMIRASQRGRYLYLEVARTLRARIEEGTYPSGSKIPSFEELCQEFGVSAITVRTALRELDREGLIHGHQGLGVFVRERGAIHRVLAGNPQSSIGEEIARAGFEARIVEISSGEFKADASLADQLKIRTGTRLFRHEKMTYAGEEPVALHTISMNLGLARQLKHDLGRYFLFPMLASHGIDVANLRCEFSAAGLTERQAGLFALTSGYPMLLVRYTPCSIDGKPILSGVTLARSDRFSFEVNLPQKKA